MKPTTLLLLATISGLFGETIPLVNPSGEINNGIDKTAISDSSVIGWDAAA